MRIPGGSNGPEPTVEQGSRGAEPRLERDTLELLAAFERLSDDASSSLRDQVDRRPYVMLGLGFFGGYVLGGGLTLRLGTLVLAAVGRAALASLITRSHAAPRPAGAT